MQAMTFPIPICFGQKMSIPDLETLWSAPDDTPVVAWSMQQPAAIERLRNDGKLSGDPKFAFAPDLDGKKKAGKRTA
jgi:hypothetical protein